MRGPQGLRAVCRDDIGTEPFDCSPFGPLSPNVRSVTMPRMHNAGKIIVIPMAAGLSFLVGASAGAEPLCRDTKCKAVLEDTATNGPHGGRPTPPTVGGWIVSAAATTTSGTATAAFGTL
jgi:hypothetical protein